MRKEKTKQYLVIGFSGKTCSDDAYQQARVNQP